MWACGAWLPALFADLVDLRITQQDVFYFGASAAWRTPGVPTWVDYDAAAYGVGDVDGRGVKVCSDREGPAGFEGLSGQGDQQSGVGMALVDGGKVVYQGGLGVRELGKPEPVDENTLFMAASNTKGMTTLLLAELVDEKKLQWDEAVIEVYPSFKLGNADTTKKVLVKNLICACTGLPRQDLE